jgi:quercetin dioxygenase-like cupin family protein
VSRALRASTIAAMEHWNLHELDVEPHQPKILHSARGEARSIAISLPAGEELQEHEVHERAYLVVVDGEVEVEHAGPPAHGGAGFAAVFDPHERHTVRAVTDARLLLLLAPWPGDGHPGARDK